MIQLLVEGDVPRLPGKSSRNSVFVHGDPGDGADAETQEDRKEMKMEETTVVANMVAKRSVGEGRAKQRNERRTRRDLSRLRRPRPGAPSERRAGDSTNLVTCTPIYRPHTKNETDGVRTSRCHSRPRRNEHSRLLGVAAPLFDRSSLSHGALGWYFLQLTRN